jgi:hypothetical protein
MNPSINRPRRLEMDSGLSKQVRLPGMWTADAGELRQWQTHAQLAKGFSERNGANASELPERARTCGTCGVRSGRICVLNKAKEGAPPDKQPTCPDCVADDFLQHQLAERGAEAVTPPPEPAPAPEPAAGKAEAEGGDWRRRLETAALADQAKIGELCSLYHLL